ncbi:MAG TPA: hypothetical protein VF334_11750 [Polyangia bacterium]
MLLASLAVAGCGGNHAPSTTSQLADVIVTATAIPSDGQCAHIVFTRLADFHTAEYRGLLAGATLQAPLGEDRVTATAYPQPCNMDPGSAAPWTADAQTITLASGANSVSLSFHKSAGVTIDPNFDDTKPLVVRAGSQVRTSRNGEDTAGPSYALDGWEVKQLTLPPAVVGETVLFSLEGKGVPYTPRGMAHTPDGNFEFQLAEPLSPLYVFNAVGAPVAQWAVSYPAGTTLWSNTDGLEAIDASHFVRTGWSNRPFGCDASGAHCKQSGLDILTKKTAADGSSYVEVTQQIFLPELPTEALNSEYPVGVTPVGARFAVTVLPDAGTNLVLLDADGTVAAGPVVMPSASDIEGLFDDGAGRLVGVDYTGNLTEYNDTDLSKRMETGNLGEGVSFGPPSRLAWRSAGAGSLIAYNGTRLTYAAADFSSVTDVGLDLSAFALVGALEYRADTDELLLIDRYPSGLPSVVSFSLATKLQTSSVTLQPGLAYPLRPVALTYIPSTHQFVAAYRRSSGADATLDAVAFVHNADGSLAGKFDLATLGMKSISSVRYDATNDQLVFLVADAGGVTRLVTTDRSFVPKRSYRTDALPDLADVTPMATGPFAGDWGAVQNQPSYYARVALP